MSLFDDTSTPALSFKDKPVGTTYTGVVTRAPELVQSRDYLTGEAATWPDGNPKMSAVLTLRVNGEEVSLWAPKPSAMFAALGQAEKAAGKSIDVGGTLTVTFTGEKPNATNPRLNPQKLYSASYVPGSAFADPAPAIDPFAGIRPAPATQPVADTPQPAALAAALAAGLTPPQPDVLSQASALLAAGLTAENVALALKAQGHDVDAATIAALGNAQ